jgi:hypothetical protein
MLAHEHVHMFVMRGGVLHIHSHAHHTYSRAQINTQSSGPSSNRKATKSHKQLPHRIEESPQDLRNPNKPLPTCYIRIDNLNPNQATTMNRLFGAKNNAPKPTLTSAISNVTLSQTLASLALS